MATKTNEFLGTGRRKTAIARVRLATGSGKITVNGRAFETYFPLETLRATVSQPLVTASLSDKVDIRVNVSGGGPNGQAGATRHGISRALLKSGRQPSRRPESRGVPDARPARTRTQKVRPAGCAQALPVQQALIRCKLSKPAGECRRVFLLLVAVV